MSLDTALARIASLQTLLQPQPVQQPLPQTATQFSSMLQGANAPSAATMIPSATAAPGTPAGQAILNAVRPEVGVAEQPPGSNDSPRIAQYRQATAGSGVGPWCAYFVSWAARQAGVPIGDSGQGFGLVDDVMAWGQKTGKALPPGSTPAPGDLIVWDEHIGIVERVDPDGTIHTIEGNSSDKVSQRTYGSDGGGAVGYIRLG
jgi:hypothetical protein